jgi:hypothetical protein
MNEPKLNRLFEALRAEPPPAISADFEQRVLRQVRREPKPEKLTLFDQLNLLFPRLACAAIAVICLCVAGEFFLDGLNFSGLADGVARISGQWLLPMNGI